MAHDSRRFPRMRTMMPSITDCSMSVSSRVNFAPSPWPPKLRSMIAKVIGGSISSTAEPFSGSMAITAMVVGFGIERMNSS